MVYKALEPVKPILSILIVQGADSVVEGGATGVEATVAESGAI